MPHTDEQSAPYCGRETTQKGGADSDAASSDVQHADGTTHARRRATRLGKILLRTNHVGHHSKRILYTPVWELSGLNDDAGPLDDGRVPHRDPLIFVLLALRSLSHHTFHTRSPPSTPLPLHPETRQNSVLMFTTMLRHAWSLMCPHVQDFSPRIWRDFVSIFWRVAVIQRCFGKLQSVSEPRLPTSLS